MSQIGYQKFKAREEFYNFIYKDNLLVSFSILIDPRKGDINFLAKVPNMRPTSWGSFKKEELLSKAQKTILSKTKELINKQ